MPSFDVVSKLNVQELDNAVNQARKELTTRYDFQGTHTEVRLAEDRKSILLKSSTEPRLETAYEMLLAKLAKRGVSLRSVQPGNLEQAGLNMVRKVIKLQEGIEIEKAKELVKRLKATKLKVQASIQGDELRVSGKSKDDLQEAITFLRGLQDEVKVDLQFANFRD